MSQKQNKSGNVSCIIVFGLIGLVGLVAAACFMVSTLAFDVIDEFDLGKEEADIDTQASDLHVAYSPEKAELFLALIDDFNGQGYTTQSGAPLRVQGSPMEPSAMIDAALANEIDALTPDSSLWLGQLDRAWGEYSGNEGALAVGQSVRYAVSPVVMIMWRAEAQQMGWPGGAIGWADLMNRAQSDSEFAWSHASTSTTSGLLATLAEFYAASGKTRNLTINDVQAQQTLDYVAAIEKTVRFYGQGEWDVAQQIDAQGESNPYLDAFIGQEQLVIYLNELGNDVVAVYPSEGAMWADHPLALLENGTLSDAQRLTFQRFATFITAPGAQNTILDAGYRPADLDIDLQRDGSPFANTDIVDPTQPRTGLQIPGAQVIEVVQDVWWYTKRPTDVYLVVDVSGSMDGEKMERTREALYAFLEGMQGDRDRLGLIEFYDDPHLLMGLEQVTPEYRGRLQREFAGLRAGGGTALLDGVHMAFNRLQTEGDPDHINAIVVMTDGVENESNIQMRDLTAILAGKSNVPVVVFAVAYGSDADYDTLQTIVDATGGRVWEGNPETIRNLYRIMSTYF